jgi:hypothetical protein
MQVQTYHIQQNIHQAKKDLIDIRHEFTLNRKAIQEQNNQLTELRQYKQDISISINQDHQSIEKQLNNEQKISFELKKQNKTLLYHLNILKVNENEQIQLNINDKDVIEITHRTLEQIEKEKELKQKLSLNLTQLETELNQKKNILSKHHRQQDKLKVRKNDLN